MAKYGSSNVGFVLIGGYDVLGVTRSMSDAITASTEASDALGDAWRETLPTGVVSAAVEADGLYDDATGSINDLLADNQQTSRVMTWSLSSAAVGGAFDGVEGVFGASYSRGSKVGELHKAKANYEVSGKYDARGVILHALSAETADWDTETSGQQDNAASSSAGGAAYVQCTALTLGGYTSVTITVRDSSDDITYGDLVAFTAITAAPAAERVTVSGTVERYTAMQGVFNGSGSGQSVTALVGFKRDA